MHSERTDLKPEQMVYAVPYKQAASWTKGGSGRVSLSEVVDAVHPTVLIGLSTVGGAFDEPLIRSMGHGVTRPVILPLSNPTARTEAKPADLLEWTEGRALVATGSPFPAVSYGGRSVPIAQCNNAYVFPAIGLGAVASKARRVTPAMILAAARTLSELSPTRTDPHGSLLPPVRDIRQVAVELAVAVGLEAQRSGDASPTSLADLRARVMATQWTPAYPVLEPS